MFINVSRKLLWVSICVALCQSVFAVDGVILIDQKAATSGKVTELDTPGFPVTISESGSYRLSSNLVVPDAGTTAIQITADNVSLDLGGFSIIGPNTCTPNPVHCTFSGGGGIGVLAVSSTGPSPANVRIFNGTVRGMGGHGIRMLGDGTTVERIQAVQNGGPGIVVGSGSVLNSYANLNAAGSAVIGFIVRDTIATNNVFGIFVRPGGVASGNVANFNAAVGLSATQATVTNNTANNNGSNGIDVTCPAVVVGNTAANNGEANIEPHGTCTMVDNAQ